MIRAIADDHIAVFFQNVTHHFGRGFRGIRIVSVHHNIAFGVDFPKHPSDHVSCSLHVFVQNYRSGCKSNGRGVVGGIIVIHVNDRVGKDAAEVVYYLFDRVAFVVAAILSTNFLL